MVALHPVPLDHGIPDPSIPDADLVIALPDDAALDRAGAGILVERATADDAADAWYGDIDIGGQVHPRTAWSPTRVASDPAVFSPIAVRAGWLRAHGTEPGDPALAAQLGAADADVVHLTTVVTHHGAAIETHDPAPSPPPPPATVGIVIPTAGAALDDGTVAIHRLLERLGPLPERLEIVIVIGDEFVGDPSKLDGPGRRVIRRPVGPFNFSTAMNLGVLATHSPIVLLLNDDTEPSGHAFVDRMAAHLADDRVAAVGALLTYPDGTVQHAGIVIDDARPLHPFVGWQPSATARHGGLTARDVAAVTGACLMVRRRDYLAVGGLSSAFPLSFNDIDLCVRLRRAVGRVVIEPAATLVHHETLTRTPVIEPAEWDRWISRWGEIVDPWYHPAYHRPDDPHALARNADHLSPLASDHDEGNNVGSNEDNNVGSNEDNDNEDADGEPVAEPMVVARRPVLRSRVHRGRHAGAHR